MDYEPWKMEKMLGGIECDGAGQITKATSVFGFTSLKEDPVYPVAGSDPVDPLAEWWEQEMLCVFGVVAAQWNETHATPMQEKCPVDPLAEWWEQEMLCVFGVVAAQWNETH